MNLFKTALVLFFIFTLPPVQANDLKTIERELSDTYITTKITAKLAESPLLNPFKIYVSTHQGTVTLSGHVNNKKAYVEALRLVNKTSGVKYINSDELDIARVNTAFTDAYITTKVEAAILKAKVLDDESIPLVGIHVTTENGRVHLDGAVSQSKSISAIVKRATAVKGVKSVISQLKVRQDLA